MKKEVEVCDVCNGHREVRIADGRCVACGKSLCSACGFRYHIEVSDYDSTILGEHIYSCEDHNCKEQTRDIIEEKIKELIKLEK